jgi:Flp pilus assembly protein TadB
VGKVIATLLSVATVASVAFAIVSPSASGRRPVSEGRSPVSVRIAERLGRTPRRIDAALPGLVDELVRSLQSGATLSGALVEAASVGGPLSEDLSSVADDLDSGAQIGVALGRWEERRPGTRVGQLGAAVGLALTTGGEPARLLGVVAESIRDELEVADEARALATQARASAAVVALAPVGFAVFVAPVRAGGFLGSGAGILIMVVGLLLDALGLWWMWRLSGPSR